MISQFQNTHTRGRDRCVCVCAQLINPLECFFDIEYHVALDKNPGPGCDTLLPGDHYSYTTWPFAQPVCTVKLL